ncbi:MAG: hypothetical protein V1775_06760 [Bacteroidota bacterium]
MLIITFIFDWNAFWINIIAGFFYFLAGILVSIWLIPKYTLRLINKKNIKYSITKVSAVIQELCDFITESPYRNDLLNAEQITITTRLKDIKNYKVVSLCIINVFNKIVFPKIHLVIYDYYQEKNPNDAYKLVAEEYDRLKQLRIEIERIITTHSLHLEDEIILKISNLCFVIKSLEEKFEDNILYDELIHATNSERTGVFGLAQLPEVYINLLLLLKELISLKYFEIEITKNNDSI